MSARTRKLIVAMLSAFAVAAAGAMDIRLGFSRPNNADPESVIVQIGRPPGISVPIPPGITATEKRDRILNALLANGYAVVPDGPAGLVILNLPEGMHVRFFSNGTCERHDRMRVVSPPPSAFLPPWWRIWYPGGYMPYTSTGEPAVFTAGFETAEGEWVVEVSGDELSPDGADIPGEVVCAALYERLAPLAADAGVGLLCAGDRLEVYFDPAYATRVEGVSFGTTSPTEDASAQLFDAPCPGDLDGDGAVTLSDLSGLLSNFGRDDATVSDGDLDGDGDVDLADLAGMLGLFGTTCQ